MVEKGVKMATYNGGEVVAHVGADISDYQSAMKSLSSSTSSAMSSTSQAISSIGKTLAVTGAAITALGVKSVNGFGDFQSSLNKAAVIAGGTSKDIQGLADVANHMGAVLPISAQDAADAMVAMARDGASLETIKKEFPAIAEAATAAGADLQTTASVVQQSMNIWGDSLESPQQAAAILTETANLSNASIEDMQQALATIGGTASNAGISMTDTSEAIGLLTNKGFSAAQASLDLNHALLLMQAPSDKAAKQAAALGLNFNDAQGNMKPLPQILNEIADSMDGMSSSDKAAALKTMFGSSGMAAILPLMKSIKDKTDNTTTSWDAYSKAMQAASGDTATATSFLNNQANEMQKNLGSKIEQVGGNWEALRNAAMAGSAGVISSIVDMMSSTLEWATTSNSAIGSGIRTFLGLSPIIGAATLATGSFLTAATKIGSVMSTVGTALKGLFISPVGLAVLALAALVAAFAYAYNTSEQFRKTIQNLANSFKTALAPAFNFIKNTVMSFVDTAVSGFKSFADNAIRSFSKVTTGMNFNKLSDTVVVVFSALMDIVIAFGNIVTSVITVISNTGSIKSSWLSVGSVLSAVETVIGVVRDSVVSLITGFLSTGAIQSAWNAVTAVIGAVVSIVSALWSVIKSTIQSFGGVGTAGQVFVNVGQFIGNVVIIIGTVITAVANFISAAMKIQVVRDIIQAVIVTAGALLVAFKAYSIVVTIITSVKSAIETARIAMMLFNAALVANPIGLVDRKSVV